MQSTGSGDLNEGLKARELHLIVVVDRLKREVAKDEQRQGPPVGLDYKLFIMVDETIAELFLASMSWVRPGRAGQPS